MNSLPSDKKATAVSMLCEGSSIRSIERFTGIHRDTIMRLGVRVGAACKKIMDEKMRRTGPCKVELPAEGTLLGRDLCLVLA
jgi:hypothetical protein